jgi:hypothetical protein
MPKLSKQIIVGAPAHTVWQVIGPGFDRIGYWATAIPASTAAAAPPVPPAPASIARTSVPALVDAPVAGRVCTTGIRLVPQVTTRTAGHRDPRRLPRRQPQPDLPGDRQALLAELRDCQATPAGRARLRERVKVEHALAHIGHWQGRRARYRGTRKTYSTCAASPSSTTSTSSPASPPTAATSSLPDDYLTGALAAPARTAPATC